MTASRRLLNSKPLFWLVLSVPAVPMIAAAMQPDAAYEELLHPTGEWSARLLILALMLTPLAGLLPRARPVRWLLARRRAIGVAAFAYALLHLVLYVVEMGTLGDILAELGALGIWTGWAAFALMLPLALTSNDAAMRTLKAGWKRLQRLAYPAAVLTVVHWAFVHDGVAGALANSAPLIVLQLLRLGRRFRSNNRQPTMEIAR